MTSIGARGEVGLIHNVQQFALTFDIFKTTKVSTDSALAMLQTEASNAVHILPAKGASSTLLCE